MAYKSKIDATENLKQAGAQLISALKQKEEAVEQMRHATLRLHTIDCLIRDTHQIIVDSLKYQSGSLHLQPLTINNRVLIVDDIHHYAFERDSMGNRVYVGIVVRERGIPRLVSVDDPEHIHIYTNNL